MKKQLAVCALLVALLACAVAPPFAGRAHAAVPVAPAAGALHSHPAVFDKTRFVLHMGFAFFAFHHWVYKPFRAGAFASGASHRLVNLGKAALAILFTVHELKKSYQIANGSSSATLQALVAPVNKLIALTNREYARLKGCQSSSSAGATASACDYSSSDVTNLNSAFNGFSQQSSQDGVTIKDRSTPIPGLS